jgi:hypothetical protein
LTSARDGVKIYCE